MIKFVHNSRVNSLHTKYRVILIYQYAASRKILSTLHIHATLFQKRRFI